MNVNEHKSQCRQNIGQNNCQSVAVKQWHSDCTYNFLCVYVPHGTDANNGKL